MQVFINWLFEKWIDLLALAIAAWSAYTGFKADRRAVEADRKTEETKEKSEKNKEELQKVRNELIASENYGQLKMIERSFSETARKKTP